jgi:predicted aspartyl protease
LNDEAATAQQLDRLCENENVFSYTRLPKRRLPVELPPAGVGPSTEVAENGTIPNQENSIRSKILSHFIKGKISLTPMETVMMIPGELEQLENLVKVARRKKDAELESTQVSMVSPMPTMRRICVSKTHRRKTLHLSVEINSCLIEGLVDTGASMSVMATAVVRELGLMHLVSGSETYKTASSAITQALGQIGEMPIKVGGVQCDMTFMVVDTDSYDVLLGLDLLIKIGAIVDVEQGLIQVRRDPGTNVEVLPLTMVNLVQRADSGIEIRGNDDIVKRALAKLDAEDGSPSWYAHGTNRRMITQESESKADSNEGSDEGSQLEILVEGESEFGDTELENLIRSERPQQILQLTLQNQANDFMKEEIIDADNYANWIQWVADEEQRMQSVSEAAIAAEESVLLQVQQMEIVDDNDDVKERIAKNPKGETRWGEICKKIWIDPHLEKGMEQQLWSVLERYRDVFAWNKGELGCCTIGEHIIDTQGYPPCRVTPGRLSYWEEAEVNRQINVLVELGKMRPSNSAYACRVTLPVKRDGSRRFYGDYRPLNLQTRRDAFPMPLVYDVISQLGKSAWFSALDLQSGFWQSKMAPEDVGKTALITKSGLYEWNVMPFGLKNATSTFTRTMAEVFKDMGDSFLKIFVDDLNVHSIAWQDHLQHLGTMLSRLREVNLKLNSSKCCFAAGSIVFLGHVVSREGTRPNPNKIDAVRRFPVPTNITNVRSFLGLTGYYRKYIKGYSKTAGPLFELIKKDVVFIWDQERQSAFDDLKRALVQAPVLVRPNFREPFCLDVDWSTRGVGAILS